MEFNATFLISAISFIIFVIIMNYIFYKPMEKIVDERKNLIDNNYDLAKKNNNISDDLLKKREQKLEQANSDGKSIIEQKTIDAKETKNNMVIAAQQKSANDVKENKNELNKAYDDTKNILKNDVVVLADNISKKLFGEKVALNNTDMNVIEQSMQEG